MQVTFNSSEKVSTLNMWWLRSEWKGLTANLADLSHCSPQILNSESFLWPFTYDSSPFSLFPLSFLFKFPCFYIRIVIPWKIKVYNYNAFFSRHIPLTVSISLIMILGQMQGLIKPSYHTYIILLKDLKTFIHKVQCSNNVTYYLYIA